MDSSAISARPEDPGDLPTKRLNILGASARAAATSALRAGFAPAASDRFGDLDLRHSATYFESTGTYPLSLPATLERMPRAPWIYTGALEDEPDLVAKLEQIRPLWGNPEGVLRRIRNPFLVSAALTDTETPMAPVREDGRKDTAPPFASDRGFDRDGIEWLRKRYPGGGIDARDGKALRHPYLQRWIEGQPASALFVADSVGCRCCGCTLQLVGESWLDAPALAWCGNVGPLQTSDVERAAVEALGERLRSRFRLRGLFGVDFILVPPKTPGAPRGIIPIEVNPRFTGAVEVLERAGNLRALELHAAAFQSPHPGSPAVGIPFEAPPGRVAGRAIVYAASTCVVIWPPAHAFASPDGEAVWAADLPSSGTRLERGQPVLSVFAQATSISACKAQLEAHAERARRYLHRFSEASY